MYVLDARNYSNLIPLIRSADINTLFALSVLEQKVEGKVFIDQEVSPSSFYIQHPYGMALLFGETDQEDFYLQLSSYMLDSDNERSKYKWLQVYPASLYSKMEGIWDSKLIRKDSDESYTSSSLPEEENKVLEYQRINFVFNQVKYSQLERGLLNKGFQIVRTSEWLFNQLDGSVVPKHFWNNSSDFVKNGIGFTLLSGQGLPVSTAFASFIIDDQLEIGIETHKEHQDSGFAFIVCAELIDYCLANAYEPVWACSSGNTGSRKLAHKLGFDELKRVPYYRLPK